MSRCRNRFATLLCLLICVCPFLTGCWDRLEFENRAVVLSIAVDSADEQQADSTEQQSSGSSGQQGSSSTGGEQQKDATTLPRQDLPDATHLKGTDEAPPKPVLTLTAQIAVPGRIPLGPGESGGSGGGKAQPVWLVSSQGHTVNEALVNLQQEVADKLFLGHLRVIVVSESYARKQGLTNLNDYLRRNPEIRRTANLLISKQPASEVLRTSPPLERVPALYLTATIQQATQLGKIPHGEIGDFWVASSNLGQEPYATYVQVKGKDNVIIAGLACFRGDKMVSTIEPIEIASYMEITGVGRAGYSVKEKVPGTDTYVMIRGVRRKAKIGVSIQNGVPHFDVDVHIDTLIEEKSDEKVDIGNPGIIKSIDRDLGETLTKSAELLIKETQTNESDIFGFGEYVRAKERRYWNKYIGSKDKWRTMYPRVTSDVHMTVTTRREQMKAN